MTLANCIEQLDHLHLDPQIGLPESFREPPVPSKNFTQERVVGVTATDFLWPGGDAASWLIVYPILTQVSKAPRSQTTSAYGSWLQSSTLTECADLLAIVPYGSISGLSVNFATIFCSRTYCGLDGSSCPSYFRGINIFLKRPIRGSIQQIFVSAS